MSQSRSPKRVANEISKLLDTVLGTDRFPVDIGRVAKEVSKNLADPITKIIDYELDGFEGMLRHHKRRPEWNIVYNSSSPYQGRVKFTVAHEFGHYMLHRRPLFSSDFEKGEMLGDEKQEFACNPLDQHKWKQIEKSIEGEADAFASYILMPINDFRHQTDDCEITRDLLEYLTDRYEVSLTAALLKWIEFTRIKAAIVVAKEGFALWGRASESAYKAGIFIKFGMPIPERSIAGMGRHPAGSNDNLPIPLGTGIWNFSRGSDPTRELTFFSQRLDQSISLLLFNDS